jgi:hypothetical protein
MELVESCKIGLHKGRKKNAGEHSAFPLLCKSHTHTHTYPNSWQIDEKLELHDGIEDGMEIIIMNSPSRTNGMNPILLLLKIVTHMKWVLINFDQLMKLMIYMC